jgi:hypothetical protein
MKKIIVAVCMTMLSFLVSAKEMRTLPDMSESMIPTEFEAIKSVVAKPLRNPNGGGYGIRPVFAFILESDVSGFGATGDRVWIVHCTSSVDSAVRIAWVNAETGKVTLFAMEAEVESPNKVTKPKEQNKQTEESEPKHAL